MVGIQGLRMIGMLSRPRFSRGRTEAMSKCNCIFRGPHDVVQECSHHAALRKSAELRLDLLRDIRANLEERADKRLATRVDLSDALYALLRNATSDHDGLEQK